MSLEEFGWSSFFEEAFHPYSLKGYVAGRVFRASRGHCRLYTQTGEAEVSVSGGLPGTGDGLIGSPAVGDWVVFSPQTGRIEAVLPRHAKFSRKSAGGRTREQVLASNIDALFLVTGLDRDFNPRRIERYLVLASESGARLIIVLNKADLHPDPGAALRDVRRLAAGAPVVLISAAMGWGLEDVESSLATGETAALVGSSGAGKSTLVNRLMGLEAQRVQPVRASDGRGRHTTTHRELILMPQGWLLLDMPGLRELQLWSDASGVDSAFPDIAALAARCRFRDCRHQGEPGCAVLAAVEAGDLEPGRLENYGKMQREIAHLETKQDEWAALEKKRQWKRIHKMYRRTPRPRG